MKKAIVFAALAAVIFTPVSFAATQSEASSAITAAVLKNNEARKAGFEWRDTYKKQLGPAKKAYQKGDYDKAIKMANKAKSFAELGLIQASKASGFGLHN
ncbi:MAG TPA: hypothetical protein ENI64_13535 [Gammaproteobacteria bacterium]|nr:hypothetical protein [Gammaproteobacteria bacterium]